MLRDTAQSQRRRGNDDEEEVEGGERLTRQDSFGGWRSWLAPGVVPLKERRAGLAGP